MKHLKRWGDHGGAVLDRINGFDVIECRRCQFKHIIPIPTAVELRDIYKHDYYTKEKPLYLERHAEDLVWWNLVYSERYDNFEKHLPAGRRCILDVGSGPGYFLRYGKERGWKTSGIEPSGKAAAHSRRLGLKIVEDFLSEASGKKLGLFDVVHMSEVLEHIPNPGKMMGIVRGVLRSGGILCAVVPNDYNPFQHFLRKSRGYSPWWVAPPQHINYFNIRSLKRLLTRSGFDIVDSTATFPIDIFLLMGDNYVGNEALGRLCHARRMTLEKNLCEDPALKKFKLKLYKQMSKLHLGREVIVYAKKSGSR